MDLTTIHRSRMTDAHHEHPKDTFQSYLTSSVLTTSWTKYARSTARVNTAIIPPSEEGWALPSERATGTILAYSDGSVAEDNVATDDPANTQDYLQSLQQVIQQTNPITVSDFFPAAIKCQPSECENPTLMGMSSQLDVLCFGDALSTSANPDFTTDSCRLATFRWLSELGRPDYSLECENGRHQDRLFPRTLSSSICPNTALPKLVGNSRIYGGDSIDPTALVSVRDTSPYNLEGGNEDDNTYTKTSSNSTFNAHVDLLHLNISGQAVTTSGRSLSRTAGGAIETSTTTQTQLPTVRLPIQTDNVWLRQSRVHYWLPTEASSPCWPRSSFNPDLHPMRFRESLLPPLPQDQQSRVSQDSSRILDDAQHSSTVERSRYSGREALAGKACPQERSPRNSQRSDQDQFLIISKLSGMSYKEIKAKGHFKEAESTLRGRFRTLTKSKESRVRKPQWHDKDIEMLRRAVAEYTGKRIEGTSPIPPVSQKGESETPKIPWKQVAEYVARHGTYHFGNATCRKKWTEVCLSKP